VHPTARLMKANVTIPITAKDFMRLLLVED